MRIITRYILRYLALGVAFVSVSLTCILWLSQSLRFIELVSRNGLSIIAFARLSLLLLPNLMVIILPIALFIVTLFLYHRLTVDRELIALQAAGMSNVQLSIPPMILALLVTVMCFVLTIHGVPRSVKQFREIQWTVRNNISAVLLQEGVFTEVVKGLTVYIRSRSRGGELLGLLVHDKRNNGRIITLMAERGALIPTEYGLRILMVNGNQQEVGSEDHRLSILYFDSYSLEIGDPLRGKNRMRFRDARERSITDLLTASDETGLSAVNIRRFRSEAHQRLTTPLFNLSFVAIALAFLLPGSFSRNGRALRVGAAVGIMVTIEAATLGTASLATKHPSVVPLLYILALLPLGLSLHTLGLSPRLWSMYHL